MPKLGKGRPGRIPNLMDMEPCSSGGAGRRNRRPMVQRDIVIPDLASVRQSKGSGARHARQFSSRLAQKVGVNAQLCRGSRACALELCPQVSFKNHFSFFHFTILFFLPFYLLTFTFSAIFPFLLFFLRFSIHSLKKTFLLLDHFTFSHFLCCSSSPEVTCAVV